MIFHANWLPADNSREMIWLFCYLLNSSKNLKMPSAKKVFKKSGPLWVKWWLLVITVEDDSVMWRQASSIPVCPPVSWYFLKVILGPTTGILPIDSAALGLKTVDESMTCQLFPCCVIFHDWLFLCRYFSYFFLQFCFRNNTRLSNSVDPSVSILLTLFSLIDCPQELEVRSLYHLYSLKTSLSKVC